MKKLLLTLFAILSALPASTQVASTSSPGKGVNSCSVNTMGAALLVAMVGDDSTSLTVSDSQSNTWQSGMLYDSAIKFYYVFSSSTSTSHTFQANNGSIPSAIYYACSGTATSGTPESQNGFATATSSPFQLGSVTPNNVGDSVIMGARASGSSFTVSINDSFSIPIN